MTPTLLFYQLMKIFTGISFKKVICSLIPTRHYHINKISTGCFVGVDNICSLSVDWKAATSSQSFQHALSPLSYECSRESFCFQPVFTPYCFPRTYERVADLNEIFYHIQIPLKPIWTRVNCFRGIWLTWTMNWNSLFSHNIWSLAVCWQAGCR